MSTSSRLVVAEAAAAGLAVIGLVAALAADDPWLRDFGVHPAWIPVLVFAARYGPRGMYVALAFAWGPLAIAGLAWGEPLHGLEARLRRPEDLTALACAVAVAWIAMSHVSRHARNARRLSTALDRERAARETVAALRDGVAYLRGRCDRLDASINFWRSVAHRLECGEPETAALAALELAGARCGATSGIVRRRVKTQFRAIAWRGSWPEADRRSADLSADRTALAAVARRRPASWSAVDGASERDSDVAIPVLGTAEGDVLGVIALRGVPAGAMGPADLRDLSSIATWLAPALAQPITRLRPIHAVVESTAP